MLAAGKDNIDLTRYLIQQVRLGHAQRVDALRGFFPAAREEDWRLLRAGQRVQIIKKSGKAGGVLQFGTEVVSASDGSIAALLGASPGASTAVDVMLEILERSFREHMPKWSEPLREMIPAYDGGLRADAELFARLGRETHARLGLL